MALGRRRTVRFAVAAAAAAVVTVLAGCGQAAIISGPAAPRAAAPKADAPALVDALSRLPQDGITLGRLDAPATLTVYATVGEVPQRFFDDELPGLVRRLVRPNLLNIQLRTLPSVDPASLRAAQIAQAAGLQDRLWSYVAALDRPADAREALTGVPGLRRAPALDEAGSGRILRAITRASRFALADHVGTTLPAFRIRLGAGASARPVDWGCRGCLTGAVARGIDDLGGNGGSAAGPAPRRRAAEPARSAAQGERHPGWH